MEELYEKFKSVLAENARLKHHNIDLQFRIEQLEEELRICKKPICEDVERKWFTDKQQEIIEENIRLRNALEKYERQEGRASGWPYSVGSRAECVEYALPNNVLEESQKTESENFANTDARKKLEILSENNTILKTRIFEMEAELESLRTYRRRFKKIITGLFGYKVEIDDEKITLLSLYAFDKGDVFVFHQQNDSLQLITNDFALTWKNEIQNYLVSGKSLPAFLSCITLELFNKKTFG
eukprot:jgi/Antlo1/2529/1040